MAAQKPKKDDDLFMDQLDDDFLTDDAVVPSDDDNAADDFFEDTQVPGALSVDVYQTKEEIIAVAPVPGVGKGEIELSIVDNTLTIRGTRASNREVSDEDYFVQECYWGEFSRSIILPVQVKEEEAQAELKDGMLTVRVPKTDQDKVKKITIN